MTSARRYDDVLGMRRTAPTAGEAEGAAARTCRRVLNRLQAGAGKTLLDLGCLSGDMLRFASARSLDVTGLEFSPEAAAMAQKFAPQAVVFIGSWQELPFESSTFHYVTCLDVSASRQDPRLNFSEIFRVLKPGGKACLVLNPERLLPMPLRPVTVAFSDWAGELQAAGFHLLDAWPESIFLGFSKIMSYAWKRRLWAWLPAWNRQPTFFLAAKPPRT